MIFRIRRVRSYATRAVQSYEKKKRHLYFTLDSAASPPPGVSTRSTRRRRWSARLWSHLKSSLAAGSRLRTKEQSRDLVSGNEASGARFFKGRLGIVCGGERINSSDCLSRHVGLCELRGLGHSVPHPGSFYLTHPRLSRIPNPRWRPGIQRVLCRLPIG